ncbi:MAG: hypothetical protein HN348_25705, partial [Proteobacteria bacterium]|nr:hypothetical protein [Pseudomonadota bacterium]
MTDDRAALLKAILDGSAVSRPVSDFGLRGRKSVFLSGQAAGILVERKSRYLRKDALQAEELFQAVGATQGQDVKGLVVLR